MSVVRTRLRWMRFAVVAAALTTTPIIAGTDTAWHGSVTAGEKFGIAIGRPAAEAPAALWADGYGYLGEAPCTAARALVSCRDGDIVMLFQPVDLGRKGRVYLKLEAGRIAAIAWDLTPVATQEG